MTLAKETERPQSSEQENNIREERRECGKWMVCCTAKALYKDNFVSLIGFRFREVKIDVRVLREKNGVGLRL